MKMCIFTYIFRSSGISLFVRWNPSLLCIIFRLTAFEIFPPGLIYSWGKHLWFIIENHQLSVDWRRKNKKDGIFVLTERGTNVSLPYLLYTSREIIFLRLRYFSLSIVYHYHDDIWQNMLNNVDFSKTLHAFCLAHLRS